MTRSLRALRIVATFAVLVAGCRPGVAQERSVEELGAGTSALEPPRNAREGHVDSARLDSLSRIEPGALRSVAAEQVVGWTGPGQQPFEVLIRTGEPGGATTRAFGTIARRNSARERSLGQYPCASCHLGRAIVLRDERIKDAHQDIKPLHPAQTGATCATCHAPDNVERLALKSGERASLDHTYQLCAQCHFAQARSWAGGAHGKRLDGWQGRRVVMGCADCHDPHRPAIGPRIPFRAPQLDRRRRP
ncbi:MAG TPA: hypothetical protein VFZ73_04765 [Gemmatimonadaceae bacterium]